MSADLLLGPGPVLVDVAASWCVPCQLLGAVLPKLAWEWRGRLVVHTVDADSNEAFASQWGVESYPSVLLFHDGALRARITGFKGYAPLRAGVADFLTAATGQVCEARLGEAAFVAAAEAAERAYEDSTTPAAEAVGRVLEPHWPAHEAAMAALDRQVAAGVVTPAERAAQAQAANSRLTGIAAVELAAQREATAVAVERFARAMADATRSFEAAG